MSTPTYLCKTGGPCPQPSTFPYSVYGFLILGIITYLIEIIYNKIKEK